MSLCEGVNGNAWPEPPALPPHARRAVSAAQRTAFDRGAPPQNACRRSTSRRQQPQTTVGGWPIWHHADASVVLLQ
jgi:hypothetical protein